MVNVPFQKEDDEGKNPLKPKQWSDSSSAKNFEGQPDLIPPQNLEAEEAVIGGILLDPDAIGRIADLVQPEAFYLNAHRQIFRTALMLHSQGKPTDLTAIQETQLSVLWHSAVSLIMIAVIIAHIYIGSPLGMEGALDAVTSGQVDTNWAKEHHSLWAEEKGISIKRKKQPAE